MTATRFQSVSTPHKLLRLPQIVALAALFTLCSLTAAEKDDQYLAIFNLIQHADALHASGDRSGAAAKYQQAQIDLHKFRKAYPDWNVKTVNFRMNYVVEKIAACAEKPVVATEHAPTEQNAAASTSTPTASSAVKLLNPGNEPRTPLRLHPKAGDKQSVAMTLKMSMEMQMGEMPGQSVKLPPIKMLMTMTVMQISPQGEISYEMLTSDAGIGEGADGTPQMAEALKPALESLKGLKGTGKISNRGVVLSSEMKIPPGADPQLLQAIEQMRESMSRMSVPFPEEVVGRGAKWEVKTPIKSQGMTIEQVATYEVTSLEGEQMTAATLFTQAAANQKVQNPSMPGMTLNLTKMSGEGKGELTMNFAQIVPSQAIMSSHSDFTMGIDAGGQKQTMAMKVDLQMELKAQ